MGTQDPGADSAAETLGEIRAAFDKGVGDLWDVADANLDTADVIYRTPLVRARDDWLATTVVALTLDQVEPNGNGVDPAAEEHARLREEAKINYARAVEDAAAARIIGHLTDDTPTSRRRDIVKQEILDVLGVEVFARAEVYNDLLRKKGTQTVMAGMAIGGEFDADVSRCLRGKQGSAETAEALRPLVARIALQHLTDEPRRVSKALSDAGTQR
jgi:hypothetical protein